MSALDARAQELVDGLLAEPWGRSSPSVYETGRLVALTPWLAGHDARVRHLLDAQRPDGGWGPESGPGYRIVQTLSAVDALLAAGRTEAAERGLAFAHALLSDLPPLPDMPAIELISASLIRAVNERRPGALPVPEALDDGTLDLVRSLAASGEPLPVKLLHALEILGPGAVGLATAPVEPTGTVGAAPAATAAWLGAEPPPAHDPARRFLETAARQYGGPVAPGVPITVFERGWVLVALARAGLAFHAHPDLLLSLADPIGEHGAPCAAGLPTDADTTSGALHALSLLGSPVAPDCLLGYATDTHFCTWPGEQGKSVTTNAHVLEAFGRALADGPDPRYADAAAKAARFLRETQRPEGFWDDRWHVSPYYATMSAALALAEYGGPESAETVARAVSWVRATRGADGGWGVWGPTAEETALALHVLLLADPATGPGDADARAGADFLEAAGNDHPALWHDKDLYLPEAIVEATVLAARRLAERVLGARRRLDDVLVT
ncbi:prenyltransferase/squalene oxidase repeat-containing protein [Actinocorallia sp. A-T 12471]|uniref:prenyltransferase/squalene oxidase repeat-containing protein n=1 Tax=Actinocorallia sp. A-T 12471 TaxID=3089813 RepID=UPI0029CAFD33|nr:prenyltransferase/squalene oxidase repeat-containing protein [Actinocorallia sp. A-T 12471]MDX6743295.1 prenyltransferase/squalene oxidase repeat-containing protein [Actinocorallia sp. A-T 12471]